MSVNTLASRFISSSLTGFYQQLLARRLGFRQIAETLIKIAENAHAFREFDKVYEVGELLSNLPLKEYRHIGHFYIALSKCRNGLGDMEKARVSLERLADALPMHYRAKSLLLLAAINGAKRNPEQELYFFTESLKINPLNLQAFRGIAVLKAKEGYNSHALKELEQLYPLARYASPHVYFDYLNSYAVELSEAGQLQEAKNVSALAISSPFTPYYPEWQETYSEVNQKLHKRRSTVAISTPKPKRKLKPKPVAEPNLAKIIQFPKPKAKELYNSMELPALTPIQWLAAMLKTKYGPFIGLFIPDADDDIDRFCDAYLDLVINLYE